MSRNPVLVKAPPHFSNMSSSLVLNVDLAIGFNIPETEINDFHL